MLIATLVLGISVTTAMFSVLDAVLLRPLPFVDSERVVLLPGAEHNRIDFWNSNRTFEHIAVYSSGGANLVASGTVIRAQIAEVSPDYFAVFGVEPITGSVFGAHDTIPGSDHVAILGYAFWQQNFGASRDSLGKTIRINGESYAVTGVMPPGFAIPGNTSLWVPMPHDSIGLGLAPGEQISLPSNLASQVVARLRAGVTLPQARVEMEDLRRQQTKQFGTRHGSTSQVVVIPYSQLLVKHYRTELLMLFLAAGLVLLIACTNAGGLLFARGAMRRKELAVRMSLGASRWRIVRQLLAESVVIATASSVAAIAVSSILIQAIRVFGPAEVPRLAGVTLNLRAFEFAIVVSLTTGLFAGLWPAIRNSEMRILPAMQSAGPGAVAQFSSRSRRVLIVAEIAAAMALTCTAGVALRSLHNLLAVDVGFMREHVLTLTRTPTAGAPQDRRRCRASARDAYGRDRCPASHAQHSARDPRCDFCR